MRQVVIAHLALLLVFSLDRDPFSHLHEGHEHGLDEPGHEHVALAFHTHVELDSSPSHHDNEPEISAFKASAQAQPLSFFQFRPETSPPLPVMTQEPASLSPLVCRAALFGWIGTIEAAMIHNGSGHSRVLE